MDNVQYSMFNVQWPCDDGVGKYCLWLDAKKNFVQNRLQTTASRKKVWRNVEVSFAADIKILFLVML